MRMQYLLDVLDGILHSVSRFGVLPRRELDFDVYDICNVSQCGDLAVLGVRENQHASAGKELEELVLAHEK